MDEMPENSSPILDGGSYDNYKTEKPKKPEKKKKDKKKNSKRNSVIVCIILAIIIALEVVVSGYFLYRNNRNKRITADNKKVISMTWQNVSSKDFDGIVKSLPDNFVDKIDKAYSLDKDGIKKALDNFLVVDGKTTLASKLTEPGKIKIENYKQSVLNSQNRKTYFKDVVSNLYNGNMDDYEDEFVNIFKCSYDILGEADDLYYVTDTVTDGNGSYDHKTITFKYKNKSYNIQTEIFTELCCYYYSGFMSSYKEASESTESTTD